MTESKVFLVFNTAYFGDVLLCNTLCQNIKLIYPASKVVMVVDKPFYDVAKYQKDVDDVVIFDKRGEQKSPAGILKFILNFPYKNPYCSFITYTNVRNSIVSKLIGAKKVVCLPKNNPAESVQKRSLGLLSRITDKPLKNLPIRYIASDELPAKLDLDLTKKYVGLCTLSKRKEKDMPLETAIEIISDLSSRGKTVLLFGAGEECRKYRDKLKAKGCLNFVDLIDQTTIYQMANIMQLCKVVISIDTGTMHLAYATGTPTVCIFYKKDMITKWAPRKSLYPHTIIIDKNYTAENICNKTIELINK